ncbi:hypothetical protein NC652_026428 [Populus alba x Populus x berolinensis]|nr:hypothetical protein NC652_026428 [Populus alba x Populus x berolinensis]
MDNDNNGIGCEDYLLVWQLPENHCILQHDNQGKGSDDCNGGHRRNFLLEWAKTEHQAAGFTYHFGNTKPKEEGKLQKGNKHC